MRKKLSCLLEKPSYLSLERLWKQLPSSFKSAFLSAFVLGIVAHLYVFSNLLLNHDALHGINTSNAHLPIGRWAQELFSSLSWTYEMPVIIALITVLVLALCAGLTVYILDIHSHTCIFLVSGFLVSFPTIACTFAYLFTADAYFIAVFFHVAAVYLTKRYRFGWISAIVLMAVALGIYQAFIGCSVSLFLFDSILAILSNTPTKDILKRGLRYIAIIIASLVLYRLLLAFFLWRGQQVLSDYKGMSAAIGSGIMDYLYALPQTYRQLILFFWSPSYLIRPLRLLQRIMLILTAGCLVLLVILRNVYKNPIKLFFLVSGTALLPAALNLICVICVGQTSVNLLMQYSYVFAYVFALKLLEMTASEICSPRFRKFQHAAVLSGLAICVVLVWANFCVCNVAYLALQLITETSQATGIRVLSRLESLEGYVPGETPVLLVEDAGSLQRVGVAFPQLTDMVGISDLSILNRYSGPYFLVHLCGAGSVRSVSREQEREIRAAGILDSMPAFPAKDSVQYYNGVAVVKLS